MEHGITPNALLAPDRKGRAGKSGNVISGLVAAR